MIDNAFSKEVRHCFPFIKGVYTAIRKDGYDMETAMKIIYTATKMCAADEMTGGNKELKEEVK